MIERLHRHPPGTFAMCPECRQEPQELRVAGRLSREPLVIVGRSSAPPARFQLFCRCRRSTALHDTLDAAVHEWGERLSQTAIPFTPRKRRARKEAA